MRGDGGEGTRAIELRGAAHGTNGRNPLERLYISYMMAERISALQARNAFARTNPLPVGAGDIAGTARLDHGVERCLAPSLHNLLLELLDLPPEPSADGTDTHG